MAQLPTYQSDGSVQTNLPNSNGPTASAASFGTILASNLETFSKGLDDLGKVIEQKITRDSDMWVENAISKARLDWSDKLKGYYDEQ